MEKYHAVHGHDISSFDLPSTHRLPTVSAAQALEEFQANESNFVSTGLRHLDASLGLNLDDREEGGIQKGHVTEIWGPPGAGKTTFGIQLATNCLRQGQGVVWVDGFHGVSSERLRAISRSTTAEGSDGKTTERHLELFTHYTCPSLPHLIALLCRPTASCVPKGTALVVVDALSALINHAFPKVPDSRTAGDLRGSRGPPPTARRIQVLQYIVGGLQKLGATRDVAIVVLTQCATKMQAERGATLIPAVNATAWDQGISTRLVLFRDWPPDEAESRAVYFVGVQKKSGKGSSGTVDDITAFSIEQGGIVPLDCDNTQTSRALSSTPARKRKLADTSFDIEIADTDDEDYGYQDDEAPLLPPMPSQWKGSEDILLHHQPHSDEEDDQEEDEEEVAAENPADDQYQESVSKDPADNDGELHSDP